MVHSTHCRAATAAFLFLLFGACADSHSQTASPDQTVTVTGFDAHVTAAPASGASLTGNVRLEVTGTNLQNVELLPATGYTPRLGVFNISADKTFAWLDLDTRLVSGSAAGVRISAFNAPAGQPATEIVAMPARQWTIMR